MTSLFCPRVEPRASTMQRPLNMLRKSVLALCMALSLASCDEPKQDKFKSQGGISPDPSGIIAGSVLYVGPRPYCVRDEDGRPTRVQGRVVLTLFLFDNPPPPEGRATLPINLKFLNPEELFTVADCLPAGEMADPTGPFITRSIPYSWAQIALGANGETVRYQMRGFYDTDEDMNLFGVKNLPTEGDIAGAALVDVQDPSKGFLPIILPPASGAPNGYRRQGVIVALGNYIWLERPIFGLNQYRFMEATKTVVARQVANSSEIDINATLKEIRSNTCNGSLTCGLSLDQATPDEFDPVFERGDVQLDYSPDKYAFVCEPVDVLTIREGTDVSKPDGVPDPHPLLGSNLGVPWFTPMTILTRLAPTKNMQDIEALAGIPNVRLIGSILLENAVTPEEGPQPTKRTRLGSIEIAVPPVAAVELDPNNPQCRVPYLAPGNYTRAYESRLSYCSDLPTGVYNIAALSGVTGGERNEAPADVSDNGYVYDGGRYSNQAWTVPNELGDPFQVGDDRALASQSAAGGFVIYDRDVDSQGNCATAQDPDQDLMVRPVKYRGLCEPGEEVTIENPPGAVGAGIDGTGCLPSACCEGVQHLCGVPLCALCDEESCPGLDLGSNHPIRQGPTKIVMLTEDHKSVPDCLPYALPTLCCPEE
jgi:hypothetical protein